jgi:hypothetical protein
VELVDIDQAFFALGAHATASGSYLAFRPYIGDLGGALAWELPHHNPRVSLSRP